MEKPRARPAPGNGGRDETQRKSSAHEMGLHLSHSVDPEVQEKGPVRRSEDGGEGHTEEAG